MKKKIKKLIIKTLLKIYKKVKELDKKKIGEVFLFSLIIIVLTVALLKINFKSKNIDTNNIKINLDKETRGSYPKTEALWGIIEIPTLKVKTNLYRGSEELLKHGALHHNETYLPTDGKAIVIALSKEYLKGIDKLKSNDPIVLNTIYGTYKYKVTKVRTRTVNKLKQEINNIDTETLILYTNLNESERVVVYAR